MRNAVVVGNDVTLEAPLLAQHLLKQPFVGVRGDAINLVIRGHDTHDVSLNHRGLEAGQKKLAQDPLGIIGRSDVGSTFRLAVSRKVLGSGDDVITFNPWSRSLQGFDNCYCHARHKVWILTVCLFRPTPARLARDIKVRSQYLMASARPGFERGSGKDFADEIRIPGTGERNWLREAGTTLGHVAMQYFVVQYCRNAEPRALNEPLLDRIGEQRSLAWTLALSLPGNLANSVFHDLPGLLWQEVPAVR